jgi:alpha-L-fucosidase
MATHRPPWRGRIPTAFAYHLRRIFFGLSNWRWFPATLTALMVGGFLLPPDTGHTAFSAGSGNPIPVPLTAYVDNTALTAVAGTGGFDGNGDTFPSPFLPSVSTFSVRGVDYLRPSGKEDNVVAKGQTLSLPHGRYSLAYLLVASSNGEALGTTTVHYADGTSTSSLLDSPDWVKGPETGVLSARFHLTPTGKQSGAVSLYAEEVWLDSSRVATSLTLPATHLPGPGEPSMHLFALSLQPVVQGPALRVVAGRSTTKLKPFGAQIVEATVENIGTQWFTRSDPARVTVKANGIHATSTAWITALAPGEQVPVEVGIRPTHAVPAGTALPATIEAKSPNGAAASEPVTLSVGVPAYQATDESLEQHQAPEWYDNAKFGVFIHYGLYSIPAWAPVGGVYAEWYWHSMYNQGSPTYRHQLQTYGPNSTYDDFIPRFTTDKFNPHALVELIKAAGARYFVFVAKHHDGFSLFHTTVSHRNSVDMGPHRDLVRLLFDAARRYTPKIHPGVYYSLPEWYNPAFPGTLLHSDHFPGGPPKQFITGKRVPYTGYTAVHNYVHDYQVPQMKELIDQYHPDILWCDIGGPNDSLNVISHFYNTAAAGPHPHEVAVDNRCGVRTHDFTTPEQHVYDSTTQAKWETSRGIDPHSYGYNAATPPSAYATPQALVSELVDVVSKNGNFLLDIGPRGDGSIPRIMRRRLHQIGSWLETNGEAIYGTVPWWRMAGTGTLRFTLHPNKAFYITSLTPLPGRVVVDAPVPIRPGNRITLLGWHGPVLQWTHSGGRLVITVPPAAQRSGHYAWTFKLTW